MAIGRWSSPKRESARPELVIVSYCILRSSHFSGLFIIFIIFDEIEISNSIKLHLDFLAH